MKNKGKKSSYKESSIEDNYPLFDHADLDKIFKPSTEKDNEVYKDSLKVIKALLNGEITKEDYCLWLLELEKKYPHIKPTSFKEASYLLQKKARLAGRIEYKGVTSTKYRLPIFQN